MDNHVAIRMLLILASTIILFSIVAMYTSSKNKNKNKSGFSEQHTRGGVPSAQRRIAERFVDYAAANGSDSLRPPSPLLRRPTPPSASSPVALSSHPGDMVALYPSSIRASDTIADEQIRSMSRAKYSASDAAGGKSCYPRDELNPEDLVPRDSADSRWAHMNPSGKGDISDQNFLTSGFNMGIDTQSSSLRNANHQFRSEPPNPQQKVGPWHQSTIQPDTNRRPLEIDGDY